MKTFLSIKVVISIIFLFQLISSENEFINADGPFVPFVSVLSPESMKQFEFSSESNKFEENKPFASSLSNKKFTQYSLEDDRNKSSAEIIFSKIDFSVKCMYVSNFTLYDISGLGKNVLDKEQSYSHTFNDKTIFYNFCYDLKKTNECKFEKKQIFVLKKEGNETKCDPLAGSILGGNQWYTGYDSNGTNYLKIELKKEDNYPNHIFRYILQCADESNFQINSEQSYFNKSEDDSDGKYVTQLYIVTKEACPKFDFYVIYSFINDYSFIFAIILIIFGIFNCLLGKLFANYTCFILVLFASVIFVLFFAQFILPPGCAKWIIWVILVIGIIIGCACGYFVFGNYDKFLALLVGGISGLLLGELLFSLFGNFISWNQILVNILFVIICMIITIVLAFVLRDAIIIGATSFIGSYAFIRGISLFTGGYPSEFTLIDLKNQGEDEQLKKLITWRVWVYLAAIIIQTGLSVFAQIVINKNIKFDKDEGPTDTDKLVDSVSSN